MRRVRMGLLCAGLLVSLSGPGFAAPAEAPVALPATPAGRHLGPWIEAFNRGEAPALEAMMSQHYDADALKQRPASERSARLVQMRRENGAITVVRIVDANPTHIDLLVRQGSDQLVRIGFDCAEQAPHGVVGVRLEMVDDAEAALSPQPAQATPARTDAELVAAIDRELTERTRADRFSGAALLARNGSPLLRKAYGSAHRGLSVANREDTRFNLGSINKTFTKAAIAQLMEQGKVNLDDTIDRYLPDYPKAVASKVTVEMLVTMRSGIPDFFGPKFDAMDRSRLRSISDYIPLFRDEPLWFEPGTSQRYSNGSYVLLGAIIEAVSSMSYYDYVRTRIFEPAGMTRTGSYASDEIVDNLATGYTRTGSPGGALASNVLRLPARGSSAGGGYSTLDDMLAYATALRAGKLMGSAYAAWVFNGPRPSARATAAASGSMSWGIAGGTDGVNATFEISGPYVMVVLSNLDPPSAEEPSGVFRRMLEKPRP